MKKILLGGFAAVVMFSAAGCAGNKGSDNAKVDSLDVTNVPDSALYGTVGEGTSMHCLEVIDENGKTLSYIIDEVADSASNIMGGIFNGDKITFTAFKNTEGEMQVNKLINLTSLCGNWSSLDRSFNIKEDGSVQSHQPGETLPWTQWTMVNCRIVLNTDTFDIDNLGPDSLTLENTKGIFVYKRVK